MLNNASIHLVFLYIYFFNPSYSHKRKFSVIRIPTDLCEWNTKIVPHTLLFLFFWKSVVVRLITKNHRSGLITKPNHVGNFTNKKQHKLTIRFRQFQSDFLWILRQYRPWEKAILFAQIITIYQTSLCMNFFFPYCQLLYPCLFKIFHF